MCRSLLTLLFCLWAWCAQAAPPSVLEPALLRQLAAGDSEARIGAIQQLAGSRDPARVGEAAQLLQALEEGSLFAAGERLFLMGESDYRELATGATLAELPEGADGVMVNNRIRGVLANARAALALADPDAAVRRAAARELQTNAAYELEPVLAAALAGEQVEDIRALLVLAHAQANLGNPDAAARLAAVRALEASASPNTRSLLLPLTDPALEADARVREQAARSLKAIESSLALGETLGSVFTGLSLGSILLLAALGLAITYGVMGVINMAHGELLMVGAYSAYLMQSLFRSQFQALEDWYLLAAVPVAFFTAAAVGMLMERTVIRWLYGRTLETLLATWGLSLILIQAARVVFGAQNVEVANPAWMSGGITLLPNLILPWNRVIIIGFALFVLFLVWVLMNRTRLGMFVRAVTQNRAMAGCVGVPTTRIDTLAFGLGAGIAGLGGVALSQIANVGPDMGQGYIVDSFMVVVLGGVGQLAGAVWAALGLGVVTKFLEGWAGAVIAKIAVLVFIIIFIQKRPQGIFALKGRFADQ